MIRINKSLSHELFLQVSTFFEAWPIVVNLKSGLIENVSIRLCFPNYTDLLILIDKSY